MENAKNDKSKDKAVKPNSGNNQKGFKSNEQSLPDYRDFKGYPAE